jgi:hypothetical protein
MNASVRPVAAIPAVEIKASKNPRFQGRKKLNRNKYLFGFFQICLRACQQIHAALQSASLVNAAKK